MRPPEAHSRGSGPHRQGCAGNARRRARCRALRACAAGCRSRAAARRTPSTVFIVEPHALLAPPDLADAPAQLRLHPGAREELRRADCQALRARARRPVLSSTAAAVGLGQPRLIAHQRQLPPKPLRRSVSRACTAPARPPRSRSVGTFARRIAYEPRRGRTGAGRWARPDALQWCSCGRPARRAAGVAGFSRFQRVA